MPNQRDRALSTTDGTTTEKEQDDHFTRPGMDFSTAVALANHGPELKWLPHSVARTSLRVGYFIPLPLPKAKLKQ